MEPSGRRSPTRIHPGIEFYKDERVTGEALWDQSSGQYIIRTEDLSGRPTEHRLTMDELKTLREGHQAQDALERLTARETENRRIAGMADEYEAEQAVQEFIAAAHQERTKK